MSGGQNYLQTTRNGHGQSGWSPIGCEGLGPTLQVIAHFSFDRLISCSINMSILRTYNQDTSTDESVPIIVDEQHGKLCTEYLFDSPFAPLSLQRKGIVEHVTRNAPATWLFQRKDAIPEV